MILAPEEFFFDEVRLEMRLSDTLRAMRERSRRKDEALVMERHRSAAAIAEHARVQAAAYELAMMVLRGRPASEIEQCAWDVRVLTGDD